MATKTVRYCTVCGEPHFHTAGSLYCSPACRQKALRERRKQTLKEIKIANEALVAQVAEKDVLIENFVNETKEIKIKLEKIKSFVSYYDMYFVLTKEILKRGESTSVHHPDYTALLEKAQNRLDNTKFKSDDAKFRSQEYVDYIMLSRIMFHQRS